VKTLQAAPDIALSQVGAAIRIAGNNPNQYSDIVIERAPDVGGVPGTYVSLTTIPTPGSSYSHDDYLTCTAQDYFWYRVKARRTGFADSAWAEQGPIQCPSPE
jgi:hypothetical protein